MVKIKVTTAISDKETDELRFHEDQVNNVIWSKESRLEICFGGVKCDDHPDNDSVVHILGNGERMQNPYKVEISHFCCEDFKLQIDRILKDCI